MHYIMTTFCPYSIYYIVYQSGTQENKERPTENATGNPKQETPVRRTRSQTSFEKFLA